MDAPATREHEEAAGSARTGAGRGFRGKTLPPKGSHDSESLVSDLGPWGCSLLPRTQLLCCSANPSLPGQKGVWWEVSQAEWSQRHSGPRPSTAGILGRWPAVSPSRPAWGSPPQEGLRGKAWSWRPGSLTPSCPSWWPHQPKRTHWAEGRGAWGENPTTSGHPSHPLWGARHTGASGQGPQPGPGVRGHQCGAGQNHPQEQPHGSLGVPPSKLGRTLGFTEAPPARERSRWRRRRATSVPSGPGLGRAGQAITENWPWEDQV